MNSMNKSEKISGRLWLLHFTKAIDKLDRKQNNKNHWTASSWTNFLGDVLDDVAAKLNCYVVRRRPNNKEESGEYLNIDGLFIDNDAYASVPDGNDPRVLPIIAVELENSCFQDKIGYCLWKTMCIRTPIKIVMCYQSNTEKISSLKNYLENVMLKGNLINGADAEVILLIGNETVPDEKPWRDYYTVFEWQNHGFTRIDDLDW